MTHGRLNSGHSLRIIENRIRADFYYTPLHDMDWDAARDQLLLLNAHYDPVAWPRLKHPCSLFHSQLLATQKLIKDKKSGPLSLPKSVDQLEKRLLRFLARTYEISVVLALTGEIVHRKDGVSQARRLIFSEILAVPSRWFNKNDPIKGCEWGDELFQSWKPDLARSLAQPQVNSRLAQSEEQAQSGQMRVGVTRLCSRYLWTDLTVGTTASLDKRTLTSMSRDSDCISGTIPTKVSSLRSLLTHLGNRFNTATGMTAKSLPGTGPSQCGTSQLDGKPDSHYSGPTSTWTAPTE